MQQAAQTQAQQPGPLVVTTPQVSARVLVARPQVRVSRALLVVVVVVQVAQLQRST